MATDKGICLMDTQVLFLNEVLEVDICMDPPEGLL